MNQRLPLISLILNGVLAIAVVVLYVLHFNGQKSSDVNVADTDSTAEEAPVKFDNLPDLGTSNGAIAYIDNEKFEEQYQFFIDAKTSLMKENKKSSELLMKREAELQSAFQNYEQIAPSLSPEVRQKRESDLMQQKEDYMVYRDRLENDFITKQENMQKDFLKKLDTYLKSLSKEKNYSYIFTYSKGGPTSLVYAKDSLDITNQVVRSLNEQYKKKK